jgi:hypothetical protein
MENKVIKQIMIFDGNKEYDGDEIMADKELLNLIIQNSFSIPIGMINEIIEEKGIIFITIEKDSDKFIVDLKNVISLLTEK